MHTVMQTLLQSRYRMFLSHTHKFPHASLWSTPPPTQCMATTDLFSVSVISRTSYKWNHTECGLFRKTNFTQYNAFAIHLSCCVYLESFFLLLSNIPLNICNSVYLSIHQVERHLGCFQSIKFMEKNYYKYMHTKFCVNMFPLFGVNNLGMRLLSHIWQVYIQLYEETNDFPYHSVSVPFCIPTSNIWEFCFLYILTSTL